MHEFLKSKTTDFDQKPGDILRHELLGPKAATPAANVVEEHELTGVLSEISARFSTQAVDRFLSILDEIHRQKPTQFERVLDIRGPKRCYFAKTSGEIEDSGTSTQPRQIPGTNYWVMTNSPTHRKISMIRSALSVMGFSKKAVDDAATVVRRA